LAGTGTNRGFTLLELLTTLAVAAIILSFGVPNFMDVVRNSRAAAGANELVTALSIARSEAAKRGARVSVCPSDDGATCHGSWEDGWIVIADGASADDAVPVVSELLRVSSAPAGNPAITVKQANGSSTNMAWVRFLPRGGVRAPAPLPVTFNMEIESCSHRQGRNIELNAVGRTTVEQVACE